MKTIIAKGFDRGEITQIKRYFSTVFTDVDVTTKDDEAPATVEMNTSMGTLTRAVVAKPLRRGGKLDDAALKIAFSNAVTQHAAMVKRLDNLCVTSNKPLLTGRSFNRFGNSLWIVVLRKAGVRYPLMCMNNRGQLVGMGQQVLYEIFNGNQQLDVIQANP